MAKLIANILLWLLLVLLFVFMVVNRAPTEISFWPLPYVANVPLFVVFFAGALVGVLLAWGLKLIADVKRGMKAKANNAETKQVAPVSEPDSSTETKAS